MDFDIFEYLAGLGGDDILRQLEALDPAELSAVLEEAGIDLERLACEEAAGLIEAPQAAAAPSSGPRFGSASWEYWGNGVHYERLDDGTYTGRSHGW